MSVLSSEQILLRAPMPPANVVIASGSDVAAFVERFLARAEAVEGSSCVASRGKKEVASGATSGTAAITPREGSSKHVRSW